MARITIGKHATISMSGTAMDAILVLFRGSSRLMENEEQLSIDIEGVEEDMPKCYLRLVDLLLKEDIDLSSDDFIGVSIIFIY